MIDSNTRDHGKSRFVRTLAAYDALTKMQAFTARDYARKGWHSKPQPDVAPEGAVLDLYVHDWIESWMWVCGGALMYTDRVLDATPCLRDVTAEVEDRIAGWGTDSPDYWAMEMTRSVEMQIVGTMRNGDLSHYTVRVDLCPINEGGKRLVYAEAQIVVTTGITGP